MQIAKRLGIAIKDIFLFGRLEHRSDRFGRFRASGRKMHQSAMIEPRRSATGASNPLAGPARLTLAWRFNLTRSLMLNQDTKNPRTPVNRQMPEAKSLITLKKFKHRRLLVASYPVSCEDERSTAKSHLLDLGRSSQPCPTVGRPPAFFRFSHDFLAACQFSRCLRIVCRVRRLHACCGPPRPSAS